MSQDDLFAFTQPATGTPGKNTGDASPATPLASRMRPQSLAEYVGQQHVVGEGTLLRAMIEADDLGNIILHGPPGIGKTSLARVISGATKAVFEPFNATVEGVKRIREIADQAKVRRDTTGRRTILFVDEVARFSKSQQDALLSYAEDQTVVLIGATSEQPSFHLAPALLSRCEVLTLKPLTEDDLRTGVRRAVESERGLAKQYTLTEEAEILLARSAGGDLRTALTRLENAARVAGADRVIDRGVIERLLGGNLARYDRQQEHFDMASAFQKALRGSDVGAALYYAARMLQAGEDPDFVFRRLIVCASEDVGLANNNALVVAQTAYDAFRHTGPPEGFIPLAHAICVVAGSPKSDTAYTAWNNAQALAERTPNAAVPMHIRNAPTQHLAEQGYHAGYQRPFEFPHNFSTQRYMPDGVSGSGIFDELLLRKAGSNALMGEEKEMAPRIKWWAERREE